MIQIQDNMLEYIKCKYIEVMNDISTLYDDNLITSMNDICMMCLEDAVWSMNTQMVIDYIIRMSNIAYNNTSATVLPLDDGIYDQILVLYKKYNPNYQVGATPMHPLEYAENQIVDKKVMCRTVDKNAYDNLFFDDLKQQTVPLSRIRKTNMVHLVKDPITKRMINTPHKYPNLVGTLDKCKFVLNSEAIEAEVFDKPSVQVFERDYIHMCMDRNVIQPNEVFEMIGELKYDGVSVEAEVRGDTIISALSRGDTANNVATDLTPIFGGYVFKWASEIPKDQVFGIKFEAVITKYDMDVVARLRDTSYKNCRNAIIGILSATDAYKFINAITLIPISCSLDFDRRVDELEFLNKYYHSGEMNRFAVFRGDYRSILFQVKQFEASAEAIRPILPYMIDGIVVSFTDKEKIKMLGRTNFVNKYQMAVKFLTKKNRTTFIGYTYSIGKSGDVIPMAHFKPCEFIGAIHTKQTIHSYQRFKDLNLKIGDQIDIEYVNDVISYVTKPDVEANRINPNEPEKFIEKCPYCFSKIVISDSGKSAKCPNVMCPERRVMRAVDMLDRLGIKNFSEETVRFLHIEDLKGLLSIKDNPKLLELGPERSSNLIQEVSGIVLNPIPDYKFMSALSFDGMADEKWKLILNAYSIEDLMTITVGDLVNIHGVGLKNATAVIEGIKQFEEDIKIGTSNLQIIPSKGKTAGPRVVLTGFRDQAFIESLISAGYDAADNYSLTKNTYALIAMDKNENSGKIQKAKKYGVPIYSIQEFIQKYNISL